MQLEHPVDTMYKEEAILYKERLEKVYFDNKLFDILETKEN